MGLGAGGKGGHFFMPNLQPFNLRAFADNFGKSIQ
jgi:hypothetical protein